MMSQSVQQKHEQLDVNPSAYNYAAGNCREIIKICVSLSSALHVPHREGGNYPNHVLPLV